MRRTDGGTRSSRGWTRWEPKKANAERPQLDGDADLAAASIAEANALTEEVELLAAIDHSTFAEDLSRLSFSPEDQRLVDEVIAASNRLAALWRMRADMNAEDEAILNDLDDAIEAGDAALAAALTEVAETLGLKLGPMPE